METTVEKKSRYGMVINLDRCNGCGACAVACAVENNVPPALTAMNSRTGLTWLNLIPVSNNENYPDNETVYIPMFCQQCENDTPCVKVCPQNAIEFDEATGIVSQIPQRCLGCRYCMAACPYHARYFNWWDPEWTDGMKQQLNPAVSPRMRGVVEKCNFCHGRLHAAREKAAANGSSEIDMNDYVPACVEACPEKAIVFGDLNDPDSEVSKLSRDTNTFQFLTRLDTKPKVYFYSQKNWVHTMAERAMTRTGKEELYG